MFKLRNLAIFIGAIFTYSSAIGQTFIDSGQIGFSNSVANDSDATGGGVMQSSTFLVHQTRRVGKVLHG